MLAAFGKRIEHLGPVGAGHAMKAVNNALLAVNLIAVGEALAALVKAGVSARTAVEVLNASSGRSFVSGGPGTRAGAHRPMAADLPVGAPGQGCRDRTGAVREVGVESPMLELAGQLLGQARAELGEAADHVEAIRLIERRAGVEIRG